METQTAHAYAEIQKIILARLYGEGEPITFDGWLPVKEMGLTIRLAELADFAEGIGKAVELATAAPQATARAHEAPATTPPRPRKRSRRPTGLKNAPVAIPFDDDISGIGA